METKEEQFVGDDFYKCKKTGEIFTEDELMAIVDEDDNLDSFYLIGTFNSHDEAMEYVKRTFK
jgi:hypothetical protein